MAGWYRAFASVAKNLFACGMRPWGAGAEEVALVIAPLPMPCTAASPISSMASTPGGRLSCKMMRIDQARLRTLILTFDIESWYREGKIR